MIRPSVLFIVLASLLTSATVADDSVMVSQEVTTQVKKEDARKEIPTKLVQKISQLIIADRDRSIWSKMEYSTDLSPDKRIAKDTYRYYLVKRDNGGWSFGGTITSEYGISTAGGAKDNFLIGFTFMRKHRR